MIHLANQGDPGAKDDRADACAEVDEDRPAGTGEPGAEAVGDDNADEQNCQTQQARDVHPMGRDESQERSRDQKAADDGDHDSDVDAGRERRKCNADGGQRRRRNHAIGFPSRKISFEALTIARSNITVIRRCAAGGAEADQVPSQHPGAMSPA
jgi:hypothetical protein